MARTVNRGQTSETTERTIDTPNRNVARTGDRTARIRYRIRCRLTHPTHWLADHDLLHLIDETSTRLQNTAFFVGVKCMERRRRARRARRTLNSKPNMKTNKHLLALGFRHFPPDLVSLSPSLSFPLPSFSPSKSLSAALLPHLLPSFAFCASIR